MAALIKASEEEECGIPPEPCRDEGTAHRCYNSLFFPRHDLAPSVPPQALANSTFQHPRSKDEPAQRYGAFSSSLGHARWQESLWEQPQRCVSCRPAALHAPA